MCFDRCRGSGAQSWAVAFFKEAMAENLNYFLGSLMHLFASSTSRFRNVCSSLIWGCSEPRALVQNSSYFSYLSLSQVLYFDFCLHLVVQMVLDPLLGLRKYSFTSIEDICLHLAATLTTLLLKIPIYVSGHDYNFCKSDFHSCFPRPHSKET
jgi:hypothetical protein